MSTAKFEKLIDLIINEDQERAEQLFHEIVVEKSREIYESLMEDDLEEDMSEDLMSEVEAEESDSMGVTEAGDDDMDAEMDAEMGDEVEADMDAEMGDEMDADMDMDAEMGDEEMGSDEPATKDDIMNLEDKLDELMAEFEALMADEDTEEEGEEEESEEEEESGVMESVQLQAAPKPKHGDDGVQKTSPVTANSGGKGVGGDRKPVNFAGGAAETGGKAAAPKQPGATYKNSPGGGKNVGSGKGESAPKPKSEDPGKSKSPVAEAKKTVKKIVK